MSRGSSRATRRAGEQALNHSAAGGAGRQLVEDGDAAWGEGDADAGGSTVGATDGPDFYAGRVEAGADGIGGQAGLDGNLAQR